ncbi:MAG: MG2 domain-containing protein [Planctomycetota bacterium]
MFRPIRLAPAAAATALFCAALLAFAAGARPNLERADRLFEQKHYAEAAELYRQAAEGKEGRWHYASERLVMCKLRLELYDGAVEAAERYVELTSGTRQEARAERLTGHLYMLLPHWGTRSGGEFRRAERRQGIRLWSWHYDKRHAVEHMERARKLYAQYDDGDDDAWHEERIQCIFDLANLVSRFSIYSDRPHFWYSWWGERDERLAETAGERDFDEGYDWRRYHRIRPTGLPVGADGQPLWPTRPEDYSSELPDDEKILYLLGEARRLDRTEERRHTALSYYRQGMLARKRFGLKRLQTYARTYRSGGEQPLQKELEDFKPWELADDESLVLVAGQVRRVRLPEQYDVLGLLRTVSREFDRGDSAPEAGYAAGVYYQSRQQYNSALAEYQQLRDAYPESKRAGDALTQIRRIERPQVRLSDTGVQLPGRPAELQLSYRNADRVWFVARRFDLAGFLRHMHSERPDGQRRAYRWMNDLSNWDRLLVSEPHHLEHIQYEILAQFLEGEVARWSAPIEDDGSHRYAQATVDSPLEKPGAYLVYAYLKEPPPEHSDKEGLDALGLGDSRAALALTDLAYVQKRTAEGDLYYAAHAVDGSPVSGAEVDVLEYWTTYDREKKKHVHHWNRERSAADERGMALLPTPPEQNRQRHVVVSTPDGRLAWSDMTYSRRYRPSRMQEGMFAYVVTDRPVYRPEQTVRYKVWVREMHGGEMENSPGRPLKLTVNDPRGNKVHEATQRTDQFGAVDGEFTLEEEPPLGMYSIRVERGRYSGGGRFRVEEYKKPEFEVSVEPSTTHAKLGQKVSAVIKADYYFGAPVTEGTVAYKVFREEYRHTYHFPGRWDWLYGPGYGRAWYGREWLPWWGEVRRCWSPPGWWWGYRPPGRVRELVKQGKAELGEDGKLEVKIDTAPALEQHGDRDHRYVVEAEVTDPSRRTISGSGSVKVTRQAFYAMVRSDRGWYRPGEEMVLTVRCATPDGEPVQTDGMVTVSRVRYGGPDNERIEVKELDRWKASTDERGVLKFRMRHERSDRLRITFAAPDRWGGTVKGHGMVWVVGRDFEGRLYRFNDLELITDRRTYRPGQTSHVMVNTRRPDSHVIFSDDVDRGTLLDWRLLHLPDGHAVVDVPVEEGDRPNFFVEATTVADLRVHQQAARINVPPTDHVVDLEVRTDSPEYRPGEEARISLRATTPDGQPAAVQAALSAFDRAVLYIQEELAPKIAKFFYGRLRHHRPWMQTNLLRRYGAEGRVERPFESLRPLPGAWDGTWGIRITDWWSISEEEFDQMIGGGGAYNARRRRAAGPVMEEAQTQMAAKAMPQAAADSLAAGVGGGAEGEAEPEFAEAEVRQEFADTALWLPDLRTGPDGKAEAKVTMPENLTTWKVNAWAMGRDGRVGQAAAETVTTKDLLVRLQAPRFFMERDEVVLSANVHNYLDQEKTARVSLQVPEEHLALMEDHPRRVDVTVPPDGQARVDWRVKVLKQGTAAVTVEALTDEESDAMRMTFPVLVHGMTKQDAFTGSMRPREETEEQTIEFTIPGERRPELSRLEVRYAPSLAGAMLDALPYLIDYPYGCTEQTVSRFVPAVLTLKTLRNMGISLEDVREVRGRMDEIRRVEEGEHVELYAGNPVFDSDKLRKMVRKGLKRLAEMQHGDGGWSWWETGSSSPYMTGYAVWGLLTAREADVEVDADMVRRGLEFLRRWETAELEDEDWSPHSRHAFIAYVLSMNEWTAADCVDRLYEDRDELNLYGKALLTLALHNLGERDRAETVLRNIMQYLRQNEETEVAWFRTPRQGWWYWWNNDIETNAWCLRALVRVRPRSPVAPRLVKWLLENRRNGYYWRSTRDTTLCVSAMSEFVLATGEGRPDYTLTVGLDDGAVEKTVRITKDNFFTYDNRLVVEGRALSGGRHTLTIRKDGPGAVYWSAYVRYFTKEEDIAASGLQLKLDRRYYRLRQIPFEVEVEGAEGRKLTERRLRYERVPLEDGDRVESGDLVQVEMEVTADNDYTYLVFEDPKPAGCEPVRLRSGGKGQEGFHSYMELRDEKVAFFADSIGRGEHLLRYRYRAETPGVFHALPATVEGMYVPELRGNSTEHVLRIEERPAE